MSVWTSIWLRARLMSTQTLMSTRPTFHGPRAPYTAFSHATP